MKPCSAALRIPVLSARSRRPISSLELEPLSEIPNRKRSLETIRERQRPRNVVGNPRREVRFRRTIEPMKGIEARRGGCVLAPRQMDLRRRQKMLRFEAQEMAIVLGTRC